jgi:hypothetical protein
MNIIGNATRCARPNKLPSQHWLVLLLPCVLLLTTSLESAQAAEGGRRWGRNLRFRAEVKQESLPEMKRPNPYDVYKKWYPRYEGAFHSRYFNDLGLPPGDIGLRGNGMTMTPW